MLLSCCFIVSFICALLISDFAYLLSARFIRVLFVSLFFLCVTTLACPADGVNLAIWLRCVNKLTY